MIHDQPRADKLCVGARLCFYSFSFAYSHDIMNGVIDMNRPKQHHYVPRVYLRLFHTMGVNDQIHFFDKVTKVSGKTNIKNVAQEKDFYAVDALEDMDCYEKQYSTDVEPILGKLLNRIISLAKLCSYDAILLNSADRATMTEIIAHQMMRVPATRVFLREKADIVSDKTVERFLSSPMAKQYPELNEIAEDYRILNNNVFKELAVPLTFKLANYGSANPIIDAMVCTIFYNKTYEPFITSDNPVVIKNIMTGIFGLGKAGIGNADCLIAYPISPLLTAVLVHDNTIFSRRIKARENKSLYLTNVEIVRALNRYQHLQSTRQIYSNIPISISDL